MAIPPKPKPVALAVLQPQEEVALSVPSAYEERLAQYAAEVMATETPSGLKTIGTRSGILNIDGDPVPDNKLRVIILCHIRENQYFDPTIPFSEDNPQNPICFSFYEGKELEGVYAHEKSAVMQNPQQFLDPEDETKEITLSPCQTCPQWKWRSAGQGRKGKACKEVRRLAVIAADGLTLETLAVTEIRKLKIPIMSVGGYATYLGALAEVRRPPFAVITEIGTVPDQRSNFRITFKPIAPVPDEFMETLFAMIDKVKEPLMAPYDPSAPEERVPESAEDAAATAAQVAKVAPRVAPMARKA